MSNDMNQYLNEAVEEGIITSKQRLDLKLKLGRDRVDNGRRMARVGDLVLAIIFIALIMSSFIMIIRNYKNVSTAISITFSVMCMLGTIFIVYDSIRKNNYFLKEVAIIASVFSNIMFVTAFNRIISFDYYFPDNIYIGCLMTLPLMLVIHTYIARLLVIMVFCIFRVPYFNFSLVPLYNTTIVTIVVIIASVATAKILYDFLNTDEDPEEARFLTLKSRIAIQEAIVWLLVMKFNRIFLSTENLYIIYLIYIMLLIRRSSIFKNSYEMPMILDNIFFIYSAIFFVRHDVKVFHDWDILVCHIIYYATYWGLQKTDRLRNVDRIYKVQQQFYINLFLFMYIVFELQDTNSQQYLFAICVLVGIFNVYQGKVGMRLEFVVLGLIIVLMALIYTANLAYSLFTIFVIILSLSFVLQTVWRKIRDEVVRDNEK